jgi:cytochrome c biogenesis protein ResB
VIRRAWRTLIGVLASARLAVVLLVFVGAWSALATMVAQGDAASAIVVSWAKANPPWEPIVRLVGLHNAFGSPIFLVAAALLGLSTAVCAWRRTKAAASRARILREAQTADSTAMAAAHDFEIALAPSLGREDALRLASGVLELRGIRTKRTGDVLAAVSSVASPWGSTVFHWALVALIVIIMFGQMVRFEGSMALAVSQTKKDEPASYDALRTGPWRNASGAQRSFRLDALEPDYRTGGVDRGAVPTVSLLDAAGDVVVKQRVYPNNMLHSGSLAVNAPGVGLSVWLDSAEASGTVTGHFIQPVDFAQEASGGTIPVLAVTRNDAAGAVAMKVYVAVPLDRVGNAYGEWIPAKPSARIIVADAQDKVLLDRVVLPDTDLPLPGGGTLRLLGIGWYSRLSVVDDPTIPYIYAAMILAMIGLTMTVVLRQQLVVAAVVDGADGPVLALRLRLWRNVPTSRTEIEQELRSALGSADDGRMR